MILTAEGIDLFYGDAQALDGVSIAVAEKQVLAIVGTVDLVENRGEHALAHPLPSTPREPEPFDEGDSLAIC